MALALEVSAEVALKFGRRTEVDAQPGVGPLAPRLAGAGGENLANNTGLERLQTWSEHERAGIVREVCARRFLRFQQFTQCYEEQRRAWLHAVEFDLAKLAGR